MNKATYKPKRPERFLYIAHYLVDRPSQLIKLSYFMNYLNAAKSSISEDIEFIREVFERDGLGTIRTYPGSTGGVVYYPQVSESEELELLATLTDKLTSGKRILQGNYIHMSDILQDSFMLSKIGRMIAYQYIDKDIDAVMTVESKGIGIATIVARYLNVPFFFARTGATDTVGSTISVNYISGSFRKVSKMELEKDSIQPNSRVLIVDDFLRNGGTILGMIDLLAEFDSQAAGICVIGENGTVETKTLPPFDSLVNLNLVYNPEHQRYELDVKPGSLFHVNCEMLESYQDSVNSDNEE